MQEDKNKNIYYNFFKYYFKKNVFFSSIFFFINVFAKKAVHKVRLFNFYVLVYFMSFSTFFFIILIYFLSSTNSSRSSRTNNVLTYSLIISNA